jgi:hypothetical protein
MLAVAAQSMTASAANEASLGKVYSTLVIATIILTTCLLVRWKVLTLAWR